ncbi:uncharacterized protein DS421_1g14860 [Arachis hypogaea]|nr:uncharacterized protein DS421_1g14860 [Arachis hypogaea]
MMYVKGATISLFGSARSLRSNRTSIKRLMRCSNVVVSQTELTTHRPGRRSIQSKSLDHDATMVETFKYTHTLKENKERFAYQRLEAATQQSHHTGDDSNNSVTSIIDPDTVWRETISEPYKNCIYSLGSFFFDNLRTSTLRPSSTTATNRPVDPKDGVDFREQAGAEQLQLMEQQMAMYQDQMHPVAAGMLEGH